MPQILLAPPAVEPLSLADAKAFLRVAHADDDDLIAALVAAARLQVEAATRRALIAQSWRIVRDRWPADGRLVVTPAPVTAVTAARVYDAAGVASALDAGRFVVAAGAAPAEIAAAPWSLPPPGRASAGIELDLACGYGADPAAVPPPLVQAIRLLVAHWYDTRAVAAVGHAVVALPQSVAALIAPYVVRLL